MKNVQLSTASEVVSSFFGFNVADDHKNVSISQKNRAKKMLIKLVVENEGVRLKDAGAMVKVSESYASILYTLMNREMSNSFVSETYKLLKGRAYGVAN